MTQPAAATQLLDRAPSPASLRAPTRPGTRRSRLLKLIRTSAVLIVALVIPGSTEPDPTPTPHVEPGWTAMVRVFAGDGVEGVRDGIGAEARLSDPFGLAVGPNGTLYLAEGGVAQRIRAISREGIVFTIAGGHEGFRDGNGPAARFSTPSGIAVDEDGTIYVADTGNNAIRRVTRNGDVSTIAGDGVAGFRDGPARQARFNGPIGIAVDRDGRIIVADTYNDRIRVIGRDGLVTTIAGGAGRGALDGPGDEARFDTPTGVAVDRDGTVYVADTGNGLIRAIERDGNVRTRVAALPDGLMRPIAIAVSDDRDLYVTDGRGRIVEIDRNGQGRTLAGSNPGFRDGAGTEARFRRPSGIAAAGRGRLFVADAGNALVRQVAARGQFAFRRRPLPPGIAPAFDADSFRRFPLLWPVAPMEGPHEIAGTMGEARGGDAERFHAGIDVREDRGTPVRAVRDGLVLDPVSTGDFDSLNEWLRIGPLTYIHVRAGRTESGDPLDPARFVPTYDDTGRLVGMRVKRGARFRTGDVIASVNRFNHVHLNVGWSGEEHNPLVLGLLRFEDTVEPMIARGGIRLFDERGEPLLQRQRGRVVVSGRVRIVVDAWDRADGNRPSRRLGLYSLGYEVLHPDYTPVENASPAVPSIVFDRLASDPDGPRLVYAPGSGIPFYGRRVTRFLYTVTNTYRDGRAEAGMWDTSRLAPGDYILRIHAADFHGNVAMDNRDLPVTVVAAEGELQGS